MSAIKALDLKVTVITVCLNAEDTISDTLASVATQHLNNVEHLIIDGGSTDATIDRLAPYRDSLAAVVSEPDGGIYEAMNKGLSLASGDVVAFLNADDTYADSRVLLDVATLFSSATLDAVYGDVLYVKRDAPMEAVRHYCSSAFSPRQIAFGWMPAHPALFVRREVFLRDGFFDPNYRIAGDFEFVARVFSKPNFKFTYIPRILTHMRLGGASAFSWQSMFTVNREILKACRSNGINSSYAKLLTRYPRKFLERFF